MKEKKTLHKMTLNLLICKAICGKIIIFPSKYLITSLLRLNKILYRLSTHLQGPIVKELRLAGICTIEEGNKFLKTFWARFNKKFAIKPRSEEDAHQKIHQK